MFRCLQLARLASGEVAPNPMVGAVLVFNDEIIGEGYHKVYGQAHAEVNCLASVNDSHRPLIPQATLYVSLEPCAHFGKTPPCADLIIREKIASVVVGCRDPFPEVDGKGIENLKAAGVQVTSGVLENECRELNRRFFTFHTQRRPYIVLKWAQTADGKLAHADYSRVQVSNDYTNRLVHKWRSEEMAIVVGTNTAMFDDPSLTTRHWPGKNPVRAVVDLNLRLPSTLQLFNGTIPTVVFNRHRHTLPFEKISRETLHSIGVAYYQVTEDTHLVHQLLNGLYQLGVQSVLVEGGTQLLQSFLEESLWDEARVITNEKLFLGVGLPAPQLREGRLVKEERLFSDRLSWFRRSPL